MDKGLFITVEGTDGSGKTTQINMIKEYLTGKGYEVLVTREPGGTKISEKIRDIILDTENTKMGEITEMLLYASARAQLVAEVIKPALENDKIVICDRFVDSSYVYQGFGRGINLMTIADVNRIALEGIMPDITFFFDISPEIALKRRINATGADRIEKEEMDFHMRVYDGYRKLSILYPERIRTIDSDRNKEAIFKDVKACIDELLT
jgi:dTMP kinase